MSSNRYAFLDGIRGVAAIFVLTRHTLDFWGWSLYFYRSYLAVDIFFILSGFVIAHAYDEKIESGTLSFVEFLKIRLIRFYPVFFLSLLLSAAVALHIHHPINAQSTMEIVGSILLAAFFLPSKTAWTNDLFPLNGPYWSLLFELVANAIYARIRTFLTDFILTATIVSSGLVVWYVAFHHGNLDIGFSWDLESLAAGFSRSLLGIFFGLLLYRHRRFFTNLFGQYFSPWFAVVVIGSILSSADGGRFNPLIDGLIVTLVFPALVLIASQDSATRLESTLLFLGAASYPMYVLHKPLGEIINRGLHGIVSVHAPMSGLIFVVILSFVSVIIERQFDIPIRRWISHRVLKKYKMR